MTALRPHDIKIESCLVSLLARISGSHRKQYYVYAHANTGARHRHIATAKLQRYSAGDRHRQTHELGLRSEAKYLIVSQHPTAALYIFPVAPPRPKAKCSSPSKLGHHHAHCPQALGRMQSRRRSGKRHRRIRNQRSSIGVAPSHLAS